MEKGKLHDKCPACGVPATMFEDFVEKISPKRKFLLSLDLHPVSVHFPVAISALIEILSIASLVLHGNFRVKLIATLTVLGAVLPFTVIMTFVAGMFDGNIRFRKVTTQLLIKKMIFGVAYFVLSCGIFAEVIWGNIGFGSGIAVIIVCAAICLALSSVLGLIGTSLLNSKFPG